MCPRSVFALRYYRWTKKIINWHHPHNLQEYVMCQLFRKDTSLDFFAQLADKVAVREYVGQRIGTQYLNKLYGTWSSAQAINFDTLPDRFVLKTNNGCGSNVIVKNKQGINQEAIRKKLDYWLHFPYGDLTGQIHYSRIRPLILAEEYLEQEKGSDSLPSDYKFFCFQGKPQFVLYYEGRKLNGHVTSNMLFDMNWRPIEEAVRLPITHPIPLPQSFQTMRQLAATLSEGIDFVRVDFYEIGGKPIFGEMTLTPDTITSIRQDFTPLIQIHLQQSHTKPRNSSPYKENLAKKINHETPCPSKKTVIGGGTQ